MSDGPSIVTHMTPKQIDQPGLGADMHPHCPSCGIALNADGTVDELDPLDPEGHYAACEETDPCICGCKFMQSDGAFHWNTAHGDKLVAISCSEACGVRIESRRDSWGILTLLSVNDLRMSACTNADHDHTTTVDRNGDMLAGGQPMRCNDCWAPTHYSSALGTYQHDHATTPNCFLVTRDERDTPCTQPTRCADCNHVTGGHFVTCPSA